MTHSKNVLLVVLFGMCLFSAIASAQDDGADDQEKEVKFDPDALPELAEGFEASILAREPAFFHISALAIGKQGRVYAGGGPQYRDPDPDDPKDSIWVIVDKDQDGKAEHVKQFATGFNSIQGLAWHDGELWIANAPDLTYVRDTNGDLKADKYVKVFTNLGHLRHGLHGLVWAPDGRLYMSQGNSKVQEGAPEAFRKLHGVETDNPVKQPLNKVYSPEEYEADYIGEWPSAEGGYFRMGPDGQNLEIYARGMRNPWDWSFGPGFDWLAVDQDPGNYGDRVLMPFEGAYFGMYHPMVGFNWMGDDPRVAPASYHFTRYTNNSLVGTVYYLHDHFPENYRDIFFIADWANNNIYTFRQKWEGANMKDTGGMEQNFADGGENEGGELSYTPKPGKPLFRPTDMVVGPGGALYVGGWGDQYGSNYAAFGNPANPIDEGDIGHFGRVFRIRHSERPMTSRDEWLTAKRKKPYGEWTVDQLIADLGKQVRTWRTDAQLELVRRGKKVRKPLLDAVRSGELSEMAQTYAIWALGRIGPDTELFERLAAGKGKANQNLQIQALRILGDRGETRSADVVASQLDDSAPRVRMAAALNIDNIGNASHLEPLAEAMKQEEDSTVFYAQWKALRALGSEEELISLIEQYDSVNVQGGALFALNKTPDALCGHVARSDGGGFQTVREILLQKAKKHCTVSLNPSGKQFEGKLDVEITGPGSDASGLHIRYARNAELNAESPIYKGELEVDSDTELKAALFLDGKRVGPEVSGVYDSVSDDTLKKLIVSDLKVSNGKEYQVRSDALKADEKLYVDRNYTYKVVPGKVKGATYIQTANEDNTVDNRKHLQFSINKPATVYVAIDERANQLPDWMKQEEFEETDLSLKTTDVTFHLYRKTYDSGNVVLGGNSGAGASSYQVVITAHEP